MCGAHCWRPHARENNGALEWSATRVTAIAPARRDALRGSFACRSELETLNSRGVQRMKHLRTSANRNSQHQQSLIHADQQTPRAKMPHRWCAQNELRYARVIRAGRCALRANDSVHFDTKCSIFYGKFKDLKYSTGLYLK